MSETLTAVLPDHIALLGNPNCGKTALFNLLTGSRQKVANYAGVTVERKEGTLHTAGGRRVKVLDLPGAYSLNALSGDEAVTREVITGQREELPDLLVCVADATNLRLHLRLVLEARSLGLPMVVVLNKMDRAKKLGITIARAVLARELGMPVVGTVSVQAHGAQELQAFLDKPLAPRQAATWKSATADAVRATQHEVHRIFSLAVQEPAVDADPSGRIDRVIMHPVWGFVILAGVLFATFMAVFFLGDQLNGHIEGAFAWLAGLVEHHMADGLLRGLIVEGIIGGTGGVLVFLPQILILFLFILALEDSGYLPRAAFLLDKPMSKAGLSGRSFIPLLSSFACAIPGIMATRTISDWRDRLTTIMIAPLMACSARIPVYTLIIAALFPGNALAAALVMVGLYALGIVSAMCVAWVMKRGHRSHSPLMMELPSYQWPDPRSLAIGLWERAMIFLRRVGTIILALTIVMWALYTIPSPRAQQGGTPIERSLAGEIGHALQYVFAPIGFNDHISIALVPGMAAREVVVSALGTVYAMEGDEDQVGNQLEARIATGWSTATKLSLLIWMVFAPQCLSTFIIVRRETNSWRQMWLMGGYLFALAYLASFITFHVATWFTA
ncbi:MAG: ferrous iron transporter B [Flavobacteriales bacterium]|nr:ferrous iron transporter B [Flavobacteriales bacterium]MBP9081110.1 ferrous iron transporter B [Flavobacteriales bacterium]